MTTDNLKMPSKNSTRLLQHSPFMIDTEYPNLKQSFLLLLIIILIPAVFLFLTASLPQLLGLDLPNIYLPIIASVAPVICLTPVILFVSKKTGSTLEWSLKFPSLRTITILVLIMICGRIVTSSLNDPGDFITNLTNGKLRIPSIHLTEVKLNYLIIKFIGTVIFVPIVEEVLFRKQILGQFLKKYSPIKAILLASALFAISHLKPFAIGSHFTWGLLFGIIYYQTNSIEASIILHSFANLSYFFIGNELVDTTPSQIIKLIALLIVCIVVLILIFKNFKKLLPDKIIDNQ